MDVSGDSVPRRPVLRLFGGLEARARETALTRLGLQPKRLALLVYLLLATPRNSHRRDKLLALFWPDLDAAHARNSLSKALQAIRAELGEDVVVTHGKEEVSLRRETFDLDVIKFEAAIAGERLEDALAIYDGDLLDGFFVSGAAGFERWLDEERERLRDEAVQAARMLARRLVDQGSAGEAVRWIRWASQRSLGDEPRLREDLAILALSGDRAGALELYQRFADHLRTEYDAEPSRRTHALMESIRDGGLSDSGAWTPTPARDAAADSKPAVAESPAVRLPPASYPWRRIVPIGVALGLLAVLGLVRTGRRYEPLLVPGAIRPVTSDSGLEIFPAISPDGRRVAYVAGPIGGMKVYVRDIDGESARAVTGALPGNHQHPAWSPDGATLLFDREGSIYAVPAAGGPPAVVVQRTPERVLRDPSWSPRGDEIVYVANNQRVETRRLAGGEPRVVAEGVEVHSPAWSPDGRFIAYASGNYQYARGWNTLGNLAPAAIMVVPIGGSPVAITDRTILRGSPAWAPDSRHLLFLSAEDGGRDVYAVAIEETGRPAGPAERLTTGLDVGTFSLSHDGTRLVYSVFRNTANLWSAPLRPERQGAPPTPHRVTTGTEHVEFMGLSRDGEWIAFDSDRGGHPDLYRMPVIGGEPVRLTQDPDFDFAPAWSPDGREIAFHSWRRGSRDILTVSADGGEPVSVVAWPSQEFYPDWSPDGTTLVFDSNRSGFRRLYLVSRDSAGRWGEPRALTAEYGIAARWSPAGPHIAYIGGRYGLWVVDSRDGTTRALLSPASWPLARGLPSRVDWSDDGGHLYFNAFDTAGVYTVWSVPAGGGTPRQLFRLEDRTVYQEFALSGGRLYFTVDERSSDIRMLALRPGRR